MYCTCARAVSPCIFRANRRDGPDVGGKLYVCDMSILRKEILSIDDTDKFGISSVARVREGKTRTTEISRIEIDMQIILYEIL